jgi:hypothetical protein
MPPFFGHTHRASCLCEFKVTGKLEAAKARAKSWSVYLANPPANPPPKAVSKRQCVWDPCTQPRSKSALNDKIHTAVRYFSSVFPPAAMFDGLFSKGTSWKFHDFFSFFLLQLFDVCLFVLLIFGGRDHWALRF